MGKHRLYLPKSWADNGVSCRQTSRYKAASCCGFLGSTSPRLVKISWWSHICPHQLLLKRKRLNWPTTRLIPSGNFARITKQKENQRADSKQKTNINVYAATWSALSERNERNCSHSPAGRDRQKFFGTTAVARKVMRVWEKIAHSETVKLRKCHYVHPV